MYPGAGEVFTPASNARLKDKPSRDWKVAGFGVTKAHGEFQALPEVADELKGVAKTLPGDIVLDEQFTTASMLSALRKRNQVMHVASHFSFQPGNETNSFLLLGDGSRLSLADLYMSDGIYGRWNWKALVSLIAGVAAALIGLVVPGLRVLYDYAWFVGFGVAFVLYWGLMRGTPVVDLAGIPED